MITDINLVKVHRKEAFAIIDDECKTASVADLEQLITSILCQKASHTANMQKFHDEGSNYLDGRKDIDRCYLNMDDADAIVSHCQKKIKELRDKVYDGREHFIDLANVKLEDRVETTADEYNSVINESVIHFVFDDTKLLQIVGDINDQVRVLSSNDKDYYRRKKLAELLIENCRDKITIFNKLSANSRYNPYNRGRNRRY